MHNFNSPTFGGSGEAETSVIDSQRDTQPSSASDKDRLLHQQPTEEAKPISAAGTKRTLGILLGEPADGTGL